MELVNLHTEAERTAASRSRVYQLLGMAFSFPDAELFESIRDGTVAAALGAACSGLPYDVTALLADLSTVEGSPGDFESEYIRVFDVGAGAPPCPLYGGTYGGDRMEAMEDALRFYNFFHLHLSEKMRELPDHITTELEFLHYLTFREAEALQQEADPSSLRRAQRDFLARHLCKWVPKMAAKLARQETNPFFPALVRFAAGFFAADQSYVAAGVPAAQN
jgi:putative dimethyl sulfoxide reductase chaperone